MPARGNSARMLLAAATAALMAAPAAHAGGLPTAESGHRPGPDALYLPPPEAPQLQNAGPWKAPPILISGASAYREGEFLYQDFLFDDRGARSVRDPSDPFDPVGSFLFSPKTGTLTYPTAAEFANNAADLVEFRVKPLEGATAFRITLNSLADPAKTAFTIALGGEGGPARAWPHGAGVSSPAELFLTVHGETGELIDAASGQARQPAPAVSVDRSRRQFEVRVDHAAWKPAAGKVRMAAGVGLWNQEAGSYMAPSLEATETSPGGGLPAGAALFNVAFRASEPMPDVTQAGGGVTIADAAAGAIVDGAWWRERAQADALALGDVSPFYAEVDFAKLAAGSTDESAVPTEGPINRIFASRYVFGQGVDYGRVCFSLSSGGTLPKCEGNLIGQLQPYSLYVPRKQRPAAGWGLTLLLHSLSANYNQYSGSRNQSQFGERGAGSLVVTPAGRGPDGFYTDIPEADTFEVWADVARHYELDPTWAAVSGYSMGGFGTYRLAARWPDLFGRAMSIVGAASDVQAIPSLRNVPVMAWVAVADELVNVSETTETADAMRDAGLRFISDLFLTADHLTLATSDEYGPAAEFLGEHRADRSPAHVTYVVAPESDSARADAVADHAYWLSGLKLRDPKSTHGTIDVRSEGFGVGDPPVLGEETSAGAVSGGSRGPMPYVRRSQEWGPAPSAPAADRLVVKARNIGAAVVDARRARVSCAPALLIDSDGPLDLKVECAPAAAPAAACTPRVKVMVPRVRGRRIVRVTVTRSGKVLRVVKGRNVRTLTFRRPTSRAFSVRIRAKTSGRGSRLVSVLQRYPACS